MDAFDVEVGGYRLRLRQHGAGEPVILVHGSQSDYRTWEAQIGVFGEYCHHDDFIVRHAPRS